MRISLSPRKYACEDGPRSDNGMITIVRSSRCKVLYLIFIGVGTQDALSSDYFCGSMNRLLGCEMRILFVFMNS